MELTSALWAGFIGTIRWLFWTDVAGIKLVFDSILAISIIVILLQVIRIIWYKIDEREFDNCIFIFNYLLWVLLYRDEELERHTEHPLFTKTTETADYLFITYVYMVIITYLCLIFWLPLLIYSIMYGSFLLLKKIRRLYKLFDKMKDKVV